MHVDKMQTHVVSFILHIDSSEDAEPWPIFIEDLHGRTHEVTLTPGDMVRIACLMSSRRVDVDFLNLACPNLLSSFTNRPNVSMADPNDSMVRGTQASLYIIIHDMVGRRQITICKCIIRFLPTGAMIHQPNENTIDWKWLGRQCASQTVSTSGVAPKKVSNGVDRVSMDTGLTPADRSIPSIRKKCRGKKKCSELNTLYGLNCFDHECHSFLRVS